MPVEVRVVFAVVALLVWLVATLVGRHYDKIRAAAANLSAAKTAPPPTWVRIGGSSYPVADVATLRAWAREGRLGRDDLVWEAGASQWIPARDVQDLRSEFYPPGVVKWKYDLFLKIWPMYFVVLALAGLFTIMGSFSYGLASAVPALRWQSTSGTILRSAVSEEDIGPTGYPVIRYRPVVEYQYRALGRTLTSTRRDLASHGDEDRYPDRARAEEIAAALPVKGRVTVYFDPGEPQQATLDRGEGTIVAFIIGALMMAIAFVVLRGWWRRRPAAAA